MRSRLLNRRITTVVFLMALTVPPASAETWEGVPGYATLGATHISGNGFALEALTAGLGLRIGRYFGAEGELSFGANKHRFLYSNCPPGLFCVAAFVPPPPVKVSLETSGAVYATGFLPLSEKAEIFARIGYGWADLAAVSVDSFRLGIGAQYRLDESNGLRIAFTREISASRAVVGVSPFGSANDVLTASYVRFF